MLQFYAGLWASQDKIAKVGEQRGGIINNGGVNADQK